MRVFVDRQQSVVYAMVDAYHQDEKVFFFDFSKNVLVTLGVDPILNWMRFSAI
jgi:hypothetical protein